MQALGRHILKAGFGILFLGLAACTGQTPVAPPPQTPVQRPQAPVAPKPPPEVARPTSQASAELRSYLNQVQGAQLSQGLLRRWVAPVRMDVIFGAAVPPSQRKSDGADVRSYANRLARVTGHPVSMSKNPNFIVIIAGEDDRGEALAEAAARMPGISQASLAPLINLRDDTYCVVAAYAGGAGDNTYTAALAVIRAENPSLLRLSCIHEELAQGLGLANDSPSARPSIFNDDDEFALLTRQDELMLRMLYDPRLRPGMSADEARPTVQTIAAELTDAGPV